jgi:hypothetical protein
VVGGDGAPGFAHDHRVRYVACVAHALDAIHDIAGVLVERVVHRRFVVGAAAVVIDAQTAADIDVLEPCAHDLELGIYVGEFVDGVLDAANVLQLTAGVTVDELQAIQHVPLFQQRVQVEISLMKSPNLDFSPADSRQRPAPSLASLTRTPIFGRTP